MHAGDDEVEVRQNRIRIVQRPAWTDSIRSRQAPRGRRGAPKLASRLILLTQNPEIVLGVLVEIFGLDGIAARSRIARHRHTALIPTVRVGARLPWVAVPGPTVPLGGWARDILRTIRPELLCARTLVQGILRCCWGANSTVNLSASRTGANSVPPGSSCGSRCST